MQNQNSIEHFLIASGKSTEVIEQIEMQFTEIKYVKTKSPEELVVFAAMTIRLMRMLNPILGAVKNIDIQNNDKIKKMSVGKGLKIGISTLTQMIRVNGELEPCLDIIQKEAKESFGMDLPLNQFKEMVEKMTPQDKEFLDLFFSSLDEMKTESETILIAQ